MNSDMDKRYLGALRARHPDIMSWFRDIRRLAGFLGEIPATDYGRAKKLLRLCRAIHHTQLNYARLSNAYELALESERAGRPGSFVECGVWRGGCAAVMAMAAVGSRRRIWLFDSFQGMPAATEKDGDEARQLTDCLDGSLTPVGANVAPLEDVREFLFGRIKLDPRDVLLRPGWFQNTLPTARSEIGPIAILRLDGDWYESTLCCLRHLYDQIVEGGYLIVDDYGHFPGCRIAVEEFFEERGIRPRWRLIDYTGVYLQKDGGTPPRSRHSLQTQSGERPLWKDAHEVSRQAALSSSGRAS